MRNENRSISVVQRRLLVLASAIAGATGLAARASATVIYNDGFTGSTQDLAGTTPDTADVGGGTWGEGNANTYNRGGGQVVANNSGPAGTSPYGTSLAPGSYSGGYGIYPFTGVYLPVNTSSANTLSGTVDFTLSATVTPNSNGTAVGIALLNGPLAAYNGYSNGSIGYVDVHTTFVDYYSGQYDFGYSPGTGASVAQIVYSASAGTLTYLVNSTTIASQTVTTAAIAGLKDISFGFSDSGGTPPAASVSNFTLSTATAAPEPATIGLVAFGSSILLMRRRRQSADSDKAHPSHLYRNRPLTT